MSRTNDGTNGGPAFPRYEPEGTDGGPHWSASPEIRFAGMSLRDYFAAQALAGMLAGESFHPGLISSADRARKAYLDADAMLEARAK